MVSKPAIGKVRSVQLPCSEVKYSRSDVALLLISSDPYNYMGGAASGLPIADPKAVFNSCNASVAYPEERRILLTFYQR